LRADALPSGFVEQQAPAVFANGPWRDANLGCDLLSAQAFD
jgi:hypothetical protein